MNDVDTLNLTLATTVKGTSQQKVITDENREDTTTELSLFRA
jgi:hypothetical protein